MSLTEDGFLCIATSECTVNSWVQCTNLSNFCMQDGQQIIHSRRMLVLKEVTGTALDITPQPAEGPSYSNYLSPMTLLFPFYSILPSPHNFVYFSHLLAITFSSSYYSSCLYATDITYLSPPVLA